jgi:hypothetical protein
MGIEKVDLGELYSWAQGGPIRYMEAERTTVNRVMLGAVVKFIAAGGADKSRAEKGLLGGNGRKLSQGNGQKVSHPPAGVVAASVACSGSLPYLVAVGPAGCGKREAFSKGCGRVPGGGRGTAAFHTPAAPPAGEMGVPGEEGEISTGSGPGGGSDRAPRPL